MLHRTGLIGDVHAEDRTLAAALEWLAEQGVDSILCTGDVVDGAGDVDRCCRLLRDHGVVTVRGNHDAWILSHTLRQLADAHLLEELHPGSRAFIAGLADTVELETPGGSLLLCHGLGEDNMWFLGRAEDDPNGVDTWTALQAVRSWPHSFMVGGHTHHRMVRELGRLTVINPGTLKRDQEPCVGIADFDAGSVQFYVPVAQIAEGFRAAERSSHTAAQKTRAGRWQLVEELCLRTV